jgi:hypothetical protein
MFCNCLLRIFCNKEHIYQRAREQGEETVTHFMSKECKKVTRSYPTKFLVSGNMESI